MNTPLDDHELIAQLRTALDEATAAPSTAAVPELRAARPERPAGRWVAIAAATVLVVGAVAAIGVNLGNRDDSASSNDTVEPASTPPEASTATISALPAEWAMLVSPDLVPGDISVERCCTEFAAPGPTTVMAWGAVDGLENGLLLLTAAPAPDGSAPAPTFTSNGFSAERFQELTTKVVPGSGLPYVLPDDGLTLLGFGTEGAGELVSQDYTNELGTVTVSAGAYRGQLNPLVTYGFHAVAIPGFDTTGYRATLDTGGEHVVWPMPNGRWATMEVPPALADRTDGLIAALAPAPPIVTEFVDTIPATTVLEPSGSTLDTIVLDAIVGDALPPYSPAGPDAAIGMPAPQFGFAGARTLVVFTAPWCPHCKQVLPVVIGAETDTELVLVETASSPGSEIYTHADLASWGHVGPIYIDNDAGDGSAGDAATAYGVTGFPYFVLVDADGKVLRRTQGEMDEQALLDFVNG